MNSVIIWWTFAMWAIGSLVIFSAIVVLALILINAVTTRSLQREMTGLRNNIWAYRAMRHFARLHPRPWAPNSGDPQAALDTATRDLIQLAQELNLHVTIEINTDTSLPYLEHKIYTV